MSYVRNPTFSARSKAGGEGENQAPSDVFSTLVCGGRAAWGENPATTECHSTATGRALVGSAKHAPNLRDLSSRRVRRPLRFRLLLLLLRIGGLEELLDKGQSLIIRESNCRPVALSIQEPHLRSIDSCEDSNEREANSNAPMRRLSLARWCLPAAGGARADGPI